MNPPRPAWPPLIDAALPAWMKWRDAALTLVMWILFGYLFQRQFGLVRGSYEDQARLTEFAARLWPYALVAALLIVLLIIAAVFTQRRRWRSLQLPEPAPLPMADQARRAGMDEAALTAARDMRIAVVLVDDGGRHRIVAR